MNQNKKESHEKSIKKLELDQSKLDFNQSKSEFNQSELDFNQSKLQLNQLDKLDQRNDEENNINDKSNRNTLKTDQLLTIRVNMKELIKEKRLFLRNIGSFRSYKSVSLLERNQLDKLVRYAILGRIALSYRLFDLIKIVDDDKILNI